jgi:hypothetical protein
MSLVITDEAQQQTVTTLFQGSPPASLSNKHPPEAIASFLNSLARAATVVANANACGSLLAGQSSEADEFGDVGIWLESGGPGILKGNEADVLKAIGLGAWLAAAENKVRLGPDPKNCCAQR